MKLFEFDAKFEEDIICGVDEAGRGPLAGPVVAAAVILKKNASLIVSDIDDSKKFSEKKRKEIYYRVLDATLDFKVGIVSAKEIDRINILNATMLAMKNAVSCLKIRPDLVLVDGNRVFDIDIKSVPIIKGDAKSSSIAAASIIAKVTRDEIMIDLARKYGGYFFEKNKGYGTKEHYESILKYGICKEHRKTFLKKLKDKKFKIQNISGTLGEKICYGWLKKNGFNLICKNYKTAFGEIDLIAIKDKYLYFIEVKTRQKNSYFSPKEAVNYSKQKKIIRTALIFCGEHKNNYQPKFVVMEVFKEDFNEFKINFIDNAFSVNEEYNLFSNM